MSFLVAAEAYDRFMGRYSVNLSAPFSSFAGVEPGRHALDVGCGPGALTTELVRRLGAASVTAVDPSPPFVDAARERHPGVRVELASAESLPFGTATFDVTLAQLVVHFMPDPVAGITEMARVTRPGGIVAACVWDHAGSQGPLGLFWSAARELDPGVADESDLPGVREGHLEELLASAGLRDIEATTLTSRVEHTTFDAWWQPFTLGVGPAGAYATSLDPARLARLRARCLERTPGEPFTVRARAWAARGTA